MVREAATAITENSVIRLGWAVSILASCLFAAYRVGCICTNVESNTGNICQLKQVQSDDQKRIAAIETWVKVHEARTP